MKRHESGSASDEGDRSSDEEDSNSRFGSLPSAHATNAHSNDEGARDVDASIDEGVSRLMSISAVPVAPVADSAGVARIPAAALASSKVAARPKGNKTYSADERWEDM